MQPILPIMTTDRERQPQQPTSKPVEEIMSIAAAVNKSEEDNDDDETVEGVAKGGDCQTNSDRDDAVTVLSESGGSSPNDRNNTDANNPKHDPKQHTAMMRRTRTILSPYQSRVLRRVLEQTLFPSTELRNSLANMLGIKPRTIQIWFQNQRQKAKLRTSSTSSSPMNHNNDTVSSSASSSGMASVLMSGSPTPIAPTTAMLEKIAPENVRWVQFHGSALNSIPRQHAMVMQAALQPQQPQPGHIHIHPQQQQPHNQYYRHPNNITTSTYTIPYDIDHGDTSQAAARGGLDILASIASITTTVSDIEPPQHTLRAAGRVGGIIPKPHQ